MRRILIVLLTVFAGLNSYSQPIVVNTSTYTVPQLVQDVLFAPSSGGSSSCVGTINNITWSTGTNFSSTNGIGYFTNTNPSFPLASGVILSTGNVASAPGPNTTTQGNGNWPGDLQLFNYIQGLGIDGGLIDYNDATILEFDFTPLTTTMSFDFLFASEEYGTFQCAYSDAFAFFLTNVTAGTPVTNLALIPSTTTPISVVTIRDAANNNTCPSANAAYFGNYNGGAAAATAATNFNGETVMMTATSTVIPNNLYHIKLVVADRNDNQYDSAVFLGGGSFDIGTASISGTGTEFNGLEDFSGPNAICASKTVTAQAGSVPIPGATYEWTLGTTTVGNSYLYTITQAGTYNVTITYPGGCQQSDSMIVDYIPSLPIGTPNDLTVCAAPFNLTDNTPVILNGLAGPVKYYHTLLEAQQLGISSIINTTNYNGIEGEIIYAAVEDDITGCITTTQFTLHIDPSLCGVQPAPVPNLVVCDDASNDGIGTFDFTPQIPIALGSHAAADYTITFYLTQAAADAGTGAISPIFGFNNTSNPQTIYIRLEDNTNPLTFGTETFQLIVNHFANAGADGNTTVCETSVTPINLSSLIIGEDTGGVWTQTTGTGGTFNAAAGTFTPAVGATTSTFTYTVTGVAPCTNDTSLATVNINAQPTAGADGGTTVCESSTTTIDLFSLITGEQVGGTWVRSTGTGGIFNAAAGTYTPAIGATTSTFTYTVTGTAPCINDSSIATITINPQPTAGTDGNTTVCETSVTPINLFSLITGEQAGGVWTQTTGTGGTFNAATGIYTPAVGATTSTFTYTVTGVAPCINDTSLATVTINARPNAGTDGGTTVCESSTTTIDLFSLITGEQVGGTWVRSTGTGGVFNAAAGTYTPAVGATTSTFTYTLNGVAPCINDTSLATITINAQPTAGNDGGTTICENSVVVINLFTLITGEQAGGVWTRTTGTGGVFNATAGTFTPALGVTTSTFTYTVSGTAPCINDTSVATITVNPLPTATISGTTSVCMGTTPLPEIIFTGSNGTAPYTFFYTLNAIPAQAMTTSTTSSMPVSIPSTATATTYTYDLVGVSDSSSTTCSQNLNGTATVTILTAPVINTPTDYVVCDDTLNNDGIYCFTLTIKDSEVTSDSNVVVTYHETLTDSQTGANPLVSPYCNINHSGLQTIYVRAYTIGAPLCYSNTSFNLIVNPIPLPNPVITDYELCDYNNPGDGIEIFDLGTKTTEIANGQANVTVSYYATLADAQAQSNPLPNFYPNASNPQQIWINIKDITTGCNTTGSFNLIVNPLPFVTQPPTLFECSNGLVLTATFDLTINQTTVTSNVTGLTVTYYHTLAEAQTATGSIPTPDTYLGSDNEIVYIRVENNNTGCYAVTTQLLRVTQGPVALTPQPLQYCDPNNDGFGVFNLNDASNEVTGTPSGAPLPLGVSVTYHETPDDAFIGANPLASPYTNITPWSQILYVRVFYTLTGCANYVQLKLNVNPTPVATTPLPYQLCDNDQSSIGYEAFNLNTRIPEILGSIDPTLTTVTFYTTFADAQAHTNVINNPGNYTNATINTQTIYVLVQTIATGCYDIVELQLIVNPLPNATQPNYPQYSLCDVNQNTLADIGFETFDLGSKINDILLGQTGMAVTFYYSLGDAQNGTGQITNLLYTNQIQYVQTLGIRITNSATGCYVISTMDIRVEPLPTPIPPSQPYTICDGNQDGFSCDFILSSLVADMLNTANYTVTFYETLTDAQTGNAATEIDQTQPYCNIHPFVQILYVRAEDNVTHCVSVIMPIELNVNPSPIAPVTLDDITLCDQDSNPQSATTLVDLTQQTAAVLAQQPLAPSSYTVTYYNTQAAAQSSTGAGEIIPATSYMGSNGETIWVRVENNTTSCFNIGSFLLEINTPLLLTTPTPLSMCDDDASPNNQFHVFDLTVKNIEINQGTGYPVTYYPSLALAQAGVAGTEIGTPTAYQNVPAHPAVQTLGVVVTTPAGCQSITTLDIRVLPIPTPNTNPPALPPLCDDNNPGDMVEYFNLTQNQNYIANNDPNLTFHYFPTQADAASNNTAVEFIPPTSALVGHNVWIRVENNRVDFQGEHCYVLVEQALTVNPLPTVVQPLPPYRVCDDNADGIAQFDLTNPLLAPQILGASQLPADYTISYYLSAANAASGTSPLVTPYTNVTPTSQNIYIRVVNNVTGCVNATGVLTLAVEAYATATGPQVFTECDNYGSPYDGVDQVDLTQYQTTILNGQDPTVFLVSYYTSLADAVAGTNALSLAAASTYVMDSADTDTVWVKVENSSNSITPFCYALTTINMIIERYPNPVINTPNGVNTICVNYVTNDVIRDLTLNSGITNTANYSFEWYEASDPTTIISTDPTYMVTTPQAGGGTRSYTVHVTSNSTLACDTTSASFDVLQSGPAVIPAGTDGYTVTNAFSDTQIITVIIEGYGTYEYSLDDGPRQQSNIFEGVSLGAHIIHVWDSEGGIAYSCEQLIISNVEIIDYPHYFTPNGDGIHDTWNIVGLSGQPNAKIYIFDRYGKLMKQISSTGQGWDGTYNGHLMPSDDYWFSVDYIESTTAKEFKAHFSLKR